MVTGSFAENKAFISAIRSAFNIETIVMEHNDIEDAIVKGCAFLIEERNNVDLNNR